MKKLLLILSCIMLCGLMGCNDGRETIHHTETADYDWLPDAKNENEILLYDKYDQRILSYDKNRHEVITKNNTQNYMQFEFNDLKTDIYTTGHSMENHYKIIRKKDDSVSVLYEMGRDDAVFPLAYKNDKCMYFLKTSYDYDGNEIYKERVVCKFDIKNRQLKELDCTKGFLTSYGVIIDDWLYLTVFNEEDSDYTLYKMDIHHEDELVLTGKGLASGEIYSNNGKLWVSDNADIYDYENDSVRFPKKALNYFYLDHLFQISVNSDGDLELTIINTATGETEYKIDGIVDFRVKNNKVFIYTSETIIEI